MGTYALNGVMYMDDDEKETLTPQKVWEHAKAIMPTAIGLFKRRDRTHSDFIELPNRQFFELLGCDIGWPNGVTQWPPKEEWSSPHQVPPDLSKMGVQPVSEYYAAANPVVGRQILPCVPGYRWRLEKDEVR